MSIAQRYAGFLQRESHSAATPVKGEAIRQAANKILELDQENARLRADSERLEWLLRNAESKLCLVGAMYGMNLLIWQRRWTRLLRP